MKLSHSHINVAFRGRGMRNYSIYLWVIISQLFLTAVVLSQRPTPVIETTPSEAAGLSFLYTALVFVTAFIMVYIIRKRMYRLLRGIFTVFLFYASFISLTELFSYFGIFCYLDLSLGCAITVISSLAITALSFRRDHLGNLAKTILAASIAFLFISFFNDTFAYFVLTFLAAYDTYSVFRGPLSKILMVKEGDPLEPLMITHGEVSMGLGDLFSYSLAAGASIRGFGLPIGLIPVAALDLGVALTLYLLQRRRGSLPGLTIPVALWGATSLLLHLSPL